MTRQGLKPEAWAKTLQAQPGRYPARTPLRQVLVSSNLLTEIYTKGSGKIIKQTGMGLSYTQTETYTRAKGKKTGKTVMGPSNLPTEIYTTVNGKTTYSI